jgi:quercetin dioxygenase-like cupin family protein
MSHCLRLIEDRLTAGAHCAGTLPRLNRVLYVAQGDVIVTSGRPETRVAAGGAWHGGAVCSVRAGDAGARVLRFELYPDPAPELNGGVLTLDHPIDLDPRAAWLMRCDRVDFAPGGEAPLHRHRGGGIRCLLRGRIDVTVGDDPPKKITPGGAWFESGREPVYAAAAPDEETSFVRVTIQPAEIRGQSSIMYVRPADAARKPRTYAVLVDDPIALPARVE